MTDELQAALREAELRGVVAGLEAAADISSLSEHTPMDMPGNTLGHPGDSLHTQKRIYDAICLISPSSVPVHLELVDMTRLDALHAEFKKGLAEDGGEWPVFTGDEE